MGAGSLTVKTLTRARQETLRATQAARFLLCSRRPVDGTGLALLPGMLTEPMPRTERAFRKRTIAAYAAALLVAMPGAAHATSRTASMRIGAQVVASVRVIASATTAGTVSVELRPFGAPQSAVFTQEQRGRSEVLVTVLPDGVPPRGN